MLFPRGFVVLVFAFDRGCVRMAAKKAGNL